MNRNQLKKKEREKNKLNEWKNGKEEERKKKFAEVSCNWL